MQSRKEDTVQQHAVLGVPGTSAKHIVTPCHLQAGNSSRPLEDVSAQSYVASSRNARCVAMSCCEYVKVDGEQGCLEAVQRCPHDHLCERGMPQVGQMAKSLVSRSRMLSREMARERA